jgi:hypothetical protein
MWNLGKKNRRHESRRGTIWEEGDQREEEREQERVMGQMYDQSTFYTCLKMSS